MFCALRFCDSRVPTLKKQRRRAKEAQTACFLVATAALRACEVELKLYTDLRHRLGMQPHVKTLLPFLEASLPASI